MILYPNRYLESVKEITFEMLQKEQIKAIILDVDNTLIDYEKKFPEGIEQWVKQMKEKGILLSILSNSNKEEKIKMVANKLEIPYRYFAKKPFKKGYLAIAKQWNLPCNQIAVVGDQIFTDILGANRCHMYSILVKPIAKKDILITVIKRPIENFIIKQFQKRN